jgi:hypothetical protein
LENLNFFESFNSKKHQYFSTNLLIKSLIEKTGWFGMTIEQIPIEISKSLYNKLNDHLQKNGGESVNEYISKRIYSIVSEETMEEDDLSYLSNDKKKMIIERLRNKGYLD